MNESHREVEPIVNFRSKAGLTFIKMNETYTSGTLECTVLKAYSTVSKQFAADTFGEEYSQLLLDKINKFQGYYDENGNQISICRFCPGEVFGAELACTGWTASPVCLRASSDCTVMLLDFSALMSQKTLTCPCRMQVTANLMQDMAQQLLFFNTKVRILAQKRLRDRLKIYLQTLTPDEKGCYSLPYTRTELADFLCVDRSALSRELCRMRDERILDFSGAKIHLLNPTFLYGWN